MASLAQRHCLNHAAREAVAQCPECRNFFCRECIVEHDDRVLCNACLRKLSRPKTASRRFSQALADAALTIAGLLIASLFFYLIGQLLLMSPTHFHDTWFWKS